ncbi:MAG: hypothetical protein ACJ76H_13945 [Bacteriovoracaceae bacterium]
MNIKFLDVVFPFHSFKDLHVAIDKNFAGALYGPAAPDKKRRLSVSGFDFKGTQPKENPETKEKTRKKDRKKKEGISSSEVSFNETT